jgi:repressor LexA
MSEFSKRFQEAMKMRGLRQVDIVNMTKIGKSSISTYLKGKYMPKQRNIYKIAKALDVSESWLMGNDVPMQRVDPIDAISYKRGRRVPIVGTIPAGDLVFAAEHIEGYDYADVPEDREYFFLRVKGDSMINANIFSGDLILVEKQNCAESGQIVVCIVNGDEATLKRFHRHGDTVILQPENSAYAPVIVPCVDFKNGRARIIGVAREIKRKI